MVQKIVKISVLLVKSVLIFVAGVLVGSNFDRIIDKPYLVYSSSNTKLDKELQSIKQQSSTSFSFAYNTTHLWSMRLADESYYRIARLLPCRTVNYTGGPKYEQIDSCNPTTINEFSVEATLHAQKWIYEHQHPTNCSNKKFAIIHKYAWSGFGSTIHQVVWAFGAALAQDRIAVYQTPGNWVYGSCESGTPDCFFLPITNCSIPFTVDGKRTILINADAGHWVPPIRPSIFQNRTFTWYRSQLLFYLMRYNAETLVHVQRTVAQYFNPPSLDLHHPYIAVFVRRSDKVKTREMSQAYPLERYFDLFDGDARRAKITTVYINSEDDNVFNEFEKLNKIKKGYYKLLRIRATKNVVFMSLMHMPTKERGKIVLEFLTDLFIETNADLHAGTLTSNWCRLVDEIRLVLGKMIPYYTPENRFLLGM